MEKEFLEKLEMYLVYNLIKKAPQGLTEKQIEKGLIKAEKKIAKAFQLLQETDMLENIKINIPELKK